MTELTTEEIHDLNKQIGNFIQKLGRYDDLDEFARSMNKSEENQLAEQMFELLVTPKGLKYMNMFQGFKESVERTLVSLIKDDNFPQFTKYYEKLLDAKSD